MTRKKTIKKNADPVVRCAIYTRKSTEEGLDQDFNTLDAQRESGEAYILAGERCRSHSEGNGRDGQTDEETGRPIETRQIGIRVNV